jgi:predicted tellurium resistance membrane protein TerC
MLAPPHPLALHRRHPTIVMRSAGFLLMIGGSLLAEGMGVHVPKGYIYAAMVSALIEVEHDGKAERRKNRGG